MNPVDTPDKLPSAFIAYSVCCNVSTRDFPNDFSDVSSKPDVDKLNSFCSASSICFTPSRFKSTENASSIVSWAGDIGRFSIRDIRSLRDSFP